MCNIKKLKRFILFIFVNDLFRLQLHTCISTKTFFIIFLLNYVWRVIFFKTVILGDLNLLSEFGDGDFESSCLKRSLLLFIINERTLDFIGVLDQRVFLRCGVWSLFGSRKIKFHLTDFSPMYSGLWL